MKNKAHRYEEKYHQTDEQMSNIIDSKVKKDEAEGVKKLWTSECEKEEKKSVEIWER